MQTFAGHASRRRNLRRKMKAAAKQEDLRSAYRLIFYITPSKDDDKGVFAAPVKGQKKLCKLIKVDLRKGKVSVLPQGSSRKLVELDLEDIPNEPFVRVLRLFRTWLLVRAEHKVICTYAVLGEGDPGIALYNIKRVGDFLIKFDKSLRTYLHSFQLIPMLLMLSVV